MTIKIYIFFAYQIQLYQYELSILKIKRHFENFFSIFPIFSSIFL